MKFDVLTLFPEMFNCLNESILGRAIEKDLININLINIRDFSKDKHKKVDDTPYGGGAGMVIKPDVVYDAYQSVKDENAKVIYMSPQGKVLNQEKVKSLSKEQHLILLCGHYEGIDQRVIDEIVDEEISIGDYVLIAPNSYVNMDVPSHSVCLGNPARIFNKENATEYYLDNICERQED